MFESIFILLVVFFSIVLHEIAHGGIALLLGDDTAKREGRLTLNPISHIDLIGTIILPLMLLILTLGRGPVFGWAKPVPINPFNFKNKKWGIVKVSLAGPFSNFLVALLFSFLAGLNLPKNTTLFFEIIAVYNFAWAFFNLLPLFPLDGYHILYHLLPERFYQLKRFLFQYSLFILFFIVFFGLEPIFSFSRFLFQLISNLR